MDQSPSQPPPPIRALVFDCFGVLYEDALKEFIEHHVPTAAAPKSRLYYYDLALASDRGYVSDADFYAELAALSGEPPEAVRHRLRDVSALNRGLVTLIESLRPHYRIAMLSNAERSFLDRFLINHNLKRHFDTILASSETPYIKPERGIFTAMASRLNLDLPEMLFIDDSTHNTEAAQGYGIPSIHYRDPAQLRTDLSAFLPQPVK
jgi:HAD superfamily hydrolase (TIGR01509 family)